LEKNKKKCIIKLSKNANNIFKILDKNLSFGVRMKKRKVLSVWKSILLTFAGVLGVAGVTVLGVYLTKGFDEEKVLPESIAFEQTLDSGLGYFNSEANRFEVSSDFQITITTPNLLYWMKMIETRKSRLQKMASLPISPVLQ